jgi:hypothetical protein
LAKDADGCATTASLDRDADGCATGLGSCNAYNDSPLQSVDKTNKSFQLFIINSLNVAQAKKSKERSKKKITKNFYRKKSTLGTWDDNKKHADTSYKMLPSLTIHLFFLQRPSVFQPRVGWDMDGKFFKI